MSSAARPACSATAAAPMLDPHAVIAKLREDLTSQRSRNRTLLAELVRAASAPSVIGVLKGPDRECDEVVFLSNGIRLEHRWTPEHGWRYVQAECIPHTLAAVVDSVFAKRTTHEMAVVG